jgi:hypothetical protein
MKVDLSASLLRRRAHLADFELIALGAYSPQLLRQFPKPVVGPRSKVDKGLDLVFAPFRRVPFSEDARVVASAVSRERQQEIASKLLGLVSDRDVWKKNVAKLNIRSSFSFFLYKDLFSSPGGQGTCRYTSGSFTPQSARARRRGLYRIPLCNFYSRSFSTLLQMT